MNDDTDAATDGVKVFLPPESVSPAFAARNVPVFLGCDGRFFPHALTAIASLMAHARDENNYDLIIVQDGIPRERLAAAVEWMRRFANASLRFVDVRPLVEAEGKRAFATPKAVSYATYFRVFAPEVFGGYDKIVYLDTDMLLLDDVADLYNRDLRGNLVGAIHDFVAEEQGRVNPEVAAFRKEQLRMAPEDGYFNAGMLVMDLAGMRANDTAATLLRRNREITGGNLADQDVMNSVLKGRVEFIDCVWNYFDWWLDPEERSAHFELMNGRDRETVRAARERAAVLHYVEKKPWSRDYTGYNGRHYWRYAKTTPFYAESLARLKAECAAWPAAKRKALTLAQELHFRIRSLLGPARKRDLYAGRIRNLMLRRRGIDRQRALVRELETCNDR